VDSGSALLSVSLDLFALGFGYLYFDPAYLASNPTASQDSFMLMERQSLFPGLQILVFPILIYVQALTCMIGIFLAVALNKVHKLLHTYKSCTGERSCKSLPPQDMQQTLFKELHSAMKAPLRQSLLLPLQFSSPCWSMQVLLLSSSLWRCP